MTRRAKPDLGGGRNAQLKHHRRAPRAGRIGMRLTRTVTALALDARLRAVEPDRLALQPHPGGVALEALRDLAGPHRGPGRGFPPIGRRAGKKADGKIPSGPPVEAEG